MYATFLYRIGEGVMRKLADIATYAVKRTGIFYNAHTRKNAATTSVTGNTSYGLFLVKRCYVQS